MHVDASESEAVRVQPSPLPGSNPDAALAEGWDGFCALHDIDCFECGVAVALACANLAAINLVAAGAELQHDFHCCGHWLDMAPLAQGVCGFAHTTICDYS